MESLDLLTRKINIELLGQINFYLGLGLEVIMATLLGGIVGLDREKKFKSAGMKTHILICLGSTLYTAMSVLNAELVPTADPSRISAQIVSGIGFLGAGAIIQSNKSVFGLTTAATIWVVAAIGVAVGSGYVFSAMFFTLTTVAVLKLIDPMYRFLTGRSDFLLRLTCTGHRVPDLNTYLARDKFDMIHEEIFHDEEHERYNVNFYININAKDINQILYQMKTVKSIQKVEYRVLKDLSFLKKDLE